MVFVFIATNLGASRGLNADESHEKSYALRITRI
jgi:hypothetical protein